MDQIKSSNGSASRKIASVEAEVAQAKMQNQQQNQKLMACEKDLSLGQRRLNIPWTVKNSPPRFFGHNS